MDVVLVDAGGTNIGSVRYALERLGVQAELSADAARIRRASHVILPGVGAAAQGMRRLHANGLAKLLAQLTQPLLGVCLGMQLLFEYSEEGDTSCLGILPGRVRRLHGGPGLRIPHMGWNQLEFEPAGNPLLADVQPGSHVYYVHGYALTAGAAICAESVHGERFAAIVRQRNFVGMQFHPERSGEVGARLLRNFLAMQPGPARPIPGAAREGATTA